MKVALASGTHELPTDEIWYKPGDGEWSLDVESPRARDTNSSLLSRHADRTPAVNGQPAYVGGQIGAHAEWLLAGSTVVVVFVNSCLDPEDKASRTSWSPTRLLHGATMSAINSANWGGL
jgi:hypothetical protein